MCLKYSVGFIHRYEYTLKVLLYYYCMKHSIVLCYCCQVEMFVSTDRIG